MLFEGTRSTSSNMKIDMIWDVMGYYGISPNMIWDVSARAQKVSFTQFPPIVTSYKTILGYLNQNIDIDRIH